MLDRAQLSRSAAVTPDQTEEILLQAVAGAALVPDPRLAARLAELGEHDPSLKVRAAALRGLEQRGPP